MPIVDDKELACLLTDGSIAALTVDTNIFDEKGLRLDSPAFKAIARLEFPFILSGLIAREVRAHLVKDTKDALSAVTHAVGKALGSFETLNPTRDALIDQITGGRTAIVAAQERFDNYVKISNCEVINDNTLVDVPTLFDSYFDKKPPFGKGKKKSEFPDALALNALEAVAKTRNVSILVVSKDGDWRAFCEKSDRLYLVTDVERALDLVNKATYHDTEALRKVVVSWLTGLSLSHPRSEEYQKVCEYIQRNVRESSYCTIPGRNVTTGEIVSTIEWYDSELQDVTWSDEVDIIESTNAGADNALQVIVSLPMTLFIQLYGDCSDLDPDSGKMVPHSGVNVRKKVTSRAMITLRVSGLGTADEVVEFVCSELDTKSLDIKLGSFDQNWSLGIEIPYFSGLDLTRRR